MFSLASAGSTLEQTRDVMKTVNDYFRVKEKDAVEAVMTISGQNQPDGVRTSVWPLSSQRLEAAQPAGAEGCVVATGPCGVFTIRNARVFAFTPPRSSNGQCQGF